MISNLPNYQITKQLYAGIRTLVYRGIRNSDNQPVVIKLLRYKYPSFNEIIQFRNQYTIAKNLEFSNIIKLLSLEVYDNSYALIMEDFGGISLSDYLEISTDEKSQDKYLPLTEFLEIAISLTETLHYLYQKRVIHKDIKPANILINPETKEIKLIDFSIASLLPRETQEIQNPNILEGTLAYISPEQTGRMNRGIDYRSDFYSLGVTFYELLTGKLPFISEDAMELLHFNLAKKPIQIHEINSQIPPVLSKLVSKLMAKNAEQRYQTALGIKHDLEQCLTQLQQNGTIEDFELGKRDISDRFMIPEKLYGRETEVQTLLKAFDRVANGTTEIMLVAGFSGIGKTAVVNEVHKPIVRQQGYFVQGKYDQFNRNIPFYAFVQAFRNLMRQLLSEPEAKIEIWKNNILGALGENGQVLIDVIPELENIIGKQPPALELSGIAAQNRFNLLFQKFVNVFTCKEHPLVMFLDDWQWADSASLNLLKLLVQDTKYLLLLGAYRDNEVSPVHPFILTVNELVKTQATVNTITLPPLTESDLNLLVADTLNCESPLAQPLTQLVYKKTKGNPFFATQFLKVLYEEKLITFSWYIQHWQCNITQVKALAITNDVVEFMALQLQKLPTKTQDALKLAACIGAEFDLQTLAIVAQQSEINIATLLWKALQEGLILPVSDVYKFYQLEDNNNFSPDYQNYNKQNAKYKFLHDRVQQAAYSLIPDEQKQSTHLQIGQLLQQNLSETEKEEKLFEIVSHFNIAIELITQSKEREILAQLNLAAAQKARNSTAYVAAINFVKTGIHLLPTDCWQSQYELTLNLYITATETAYLNGEFEKMEVIAALVLQSAKTILDKVKIYQIQITALTAKAQQLEAIAFGRNVLAELGVEFPSEADEALIEGTLETLAKQLEGKQLEELINQPVMSEPRIIAAMQLLGMLFPPILHASPAFLPLLGATMVSLSLKFGNTPASSIGYVTYGLVLSTFLEEVEKGYYFGQVALNLLNQLNVREFRCITLLLFGAFLQQRQETLRATIPTGKEAYLASMEIGNFLYAGYSIFNYFLYNLFAGVTLDDWEPEIENYCVILANLKQDSALAYLKMQQQTVLNLREIRNQPDLLIGRAYDEALMIPKCHEDNELNLLGFIYAFKLILAYLFGNYTNARDYIAQAEQFSVTKAGQVHTPVFHFYAGLTYLYLYSTQSEIEQANSLEEVKIHQTTLAEWANHVPMNHQHKVDLLEAEKCRVLGKNYEAGDWYDQAIYGAKENEYLNEEALANELAAKFYLNWGKEKVAAGYMQEAYYCYTRWGAKGKVAHLEQTYPQLLEIILQSTQLTSGYGGTISSLTKSVNRTTHSQHSNFWLDVPAVIKAAQAISEEIELEKLLATLMQIVIANAGGETGFLVIHQQAEWLVVSKASQNQTENLQIPLVECQELPQSLIYSVARSQKTAVFDNLSATSQFVSDHYIISHQPKSVLCMPISKQGKLIAILYLENNLTVGAFTNDRLKILQMLTSQAAISIENARLYQQVENYSQTLEAEVERKTQDLRQKAVDLEQALKNLQQTQAQLIHSEKMSALGQLVAGIAHEINNPITFIHANLYPTENYFKDLLSLLETYRQEYPKQNPVIQAKIDEIDWEFIEEDLTKILDSMKSGSERIRQIILSLRNFSRLDEAEMKSVDLHAGIESTLLIVQNRFLDSNNQPKVEMIKEYGNLPKVTCYASQLNQVFLSIISNALDAVQSLNKTIKKPQIRIRTEVIEQEWVRISISDNGNGIPDAIQKRIFDPFFTTKPVGNGTGLGLSVSYAIIKKHGGQLTFKSTVGEGTEIVVEIPKSSS
ncbi:his Kinase A domain protein [Lyngbya aestuarii BL J]|uniref:histidine kinase n=2 Tax=Lyngbya aestuarii BL J TaxID=1348334 RepID=U7QNZ0_9CYAN|nr:ATP-binding sensor histidine kinase [Lyngbya aestuarii]ERT09699.1 his Kinase A domain protein [Lyngbya aestuarii BL J]